MNIILSYRQQQQQQPGTWDIAGQSTSGYVLVVVLDNSSSSSSQGRGIQLASQQVDAQQSQITAAAARDAGYSWLVNKWIYVVQSQGQGSNHKDPIVLKTFRDSKELFMILQQIIFKLGLRGKKIFESMHIALSFKDFNQLFKLCYELNVHCI